MPVEDSVVNDKELDALNEQDEHCCTHEKILRGDYLDRLARNLKSMGPVPVLEGQAPMTLAEKSKAEKLTSNAFDCI